MNERSVKRKFN